MESYFNFSICQYFTECGPFITTIMLSGPGSGQERFRSISSEPKMTVDTAEVMYSLPTIPHMFIFLLRCCLSAGIYCSLCAGGEWSFQHNLYHS